MNDSNVSVMNSINKFIHITNSEYRTKGENISFKKCPFCGGGGNNDYWTFAISTKTGQYKCMRATCAESGNLFTLSGRFNFDLEYDECFYRKKVYRKIKIDESSIIPKDSAIEYMKKRGISEDVCRRYRITAQKNNSKIIVFPFIDTEKNIVFVKYRNSEYVRGETKGNKEWCEKDCKPVLFGMNNCNMDNKTLIITEGQIDSLTLAECGIENAVSVPTGAKGFTWVQNCWDFIEGFDEIIVFGDYEHGNITLLDEMTKIFPKRIKHVRPEMYGNCKDANEIFLKYGKDKIVECINTAKFVDVPRLKPLSSVKNVDIYGMEKLRTLIHDVDRKLYGGLPFGSVHIITGKRGDGKSTLSSQIMVSALMSGYNVMAYSGELPDFMFKAWIDFQIAGRINIEENIYDVTGNISRFITNSTHEKINEWYSDRFYLYDSSIVENDEKEDILETIRNSIVRYGCRVIFIDNLMTAIDLSEQGYDKNDTQSKFVKNIAKIAMTYNVLVVLVAHKRKNNFTTDTNDEILGSSDITNLAGVILSYERNDDSMYQRKVIISKNRLYGNIDFDGIMVGFDEKSKRIYGSSDDVDFNCGWDKEFKSADVYDKEIPF